MKTAERPKRKDRTPDSEAAYVLTILQKKFAEFASISPTWPVDLDPYDFFIREVYHGFRHADGDKERDEFLECREAAAQSGGWIDHGLLQILQISLAYCTQAKRAYQAGDDGLAWSLIADANYWLGVLDMNGGNQQLVQAISGGRARWRDAPETKEKNFILECWKDWQASPKQYKSQAAFARSMLEKCEYLKSQKVIEDWCRAWKKSVC